MKTRVYEAYGRFLARASQDILSANETYYRM